MNHVVRRSSDLVSLHQQAVVRTLTEVFRTVEIDGTPAFEMVQQVYELMDDAEQELLCHQEPFDTACNIAGIGVERRQALFERSHAAYSALMEELDDAADTAELQRSPAPGRAAS